MSENIPHYEHTPFTVSPIGNHTRRIEREISAYPTLSPFWDFDTGVCNVAALKNELPNLWENEAAMGRFFCRLWTSQDENGPTLEFDIVEACNYLTPNDLATIMRCLTRKGVDPE